MKHRNGKVLLKILGCLICALLIAVNFSPELRSIRELPGNIYINGEEMQDFAASIPQPFRIMDSKGVTVGGDLSERLSGGSEVHSFTIELFGVAVKRVSVYPHDELYVMPGGESVGVTMYTNGVLVVGLGNVDSVGGKVSPASQAGIRAGDIILEIDGVTIENSSHMVELCEKNTAGEINLTVLRENRTLAVGVAPAIDIIDGTPKLGMWVRESTAGIGTLSFYIMNTNYFGALGHAITDADTGSMLQVKSGEIVESNIIGISLGEQGAPGEIKGTFGASSKHLGDIELNTQYGIFGKLHDPIINPLYPDGVPLAYPDEVRLGKAELLTSVDSGGIKAYECEIIKVYTQTGADTKGMVVKITDGQLIKKTGGIVQGMSGSPIIQNGKLIGVVTHVFINDPMKGYCVYSYWMCQQCPSFAGR